MKDRPIGFRLLLTVMAMQEGYDFGSKSFRTNNPGNLGNTDNNATKSFKTLEAGIIAQVKEIEKIVAGKHSAYPMNKRKIIKPFFSREIADNPKTYAGRSPYLPGYDFVFTGQLDQFVKIYATGPRTGNNYINRIISYYTNFGIKITPESKLQDIIKLEHGL